MNWYKYSKIFSLSGVIPSEELKKDDYRGLHQAPSNDGFSASLYDVTKIYPEDIYSYNAIRYYGHGIPSDSEAIYIIQSSRNKPNKPIKIYRAVPDFNKDTITKIKALNYIIGYFDNNRYFPMKNNIVWQLQDKYPIEQFSYNEQQKMIYNDIQRQLEQLSLQLQKPIAINPGDWITITKSYAKEYGESTLMGDYKIISKTVTAKELFTDGNSIHEWGYNP